MGIRLYSSIWGKKKEKEKKLGRQNKKKG